MSLYKSDMLTLEGNDCANMEEELYSTTLLGKANNFEDWMEKAGVDCFFTKANNHEDRVKKIKDIKKPNILRCQNPKSDNVNSLGPSNKTLLKKSEVLLQCQAHTVELSVNENVCSFILKDAQGNAIFLPQKIQVNITTEDNDQLHNITRQEVKSVNFLPIAKVNIDDTLPQITTNICAKLILCPVPDCQDAFYHISNAKLHALKHMGIKPYRCDIPDCSWEFYTDFKLQRHKETHSTRKMFMCTYKNCNRGFTTIYNLKCHKKVHEKPASLECPVKDCPKVFQTEKERRDHCKLHDPSEAPFKCENPQCTKSFFQQAALLTHMRCHSHTESELTCEFPNCGRTFHIPYRLKEHSRTHTGQRPYVCEYKDCTWRFTTASKLKRHQGTHTKDRKFHCTIGNCTKSFNRGEHLRDHTLTHIGQRSYECEACNIVFNGKSAHYTHNKKFHPEKKKEPISTATSNSIQQSSDVLLEQAIQSLDVVTTQGDIAILGPNCPLPEELLENEPDFSTVNLRDLD